MALADHPSYASTKAITVGTTIVLAHLLVPSDFGLVALASLAIGFLGLVNDLGMGGRWSFARTSTSALRARFSPSCSCVARCSPCWARAAQFADEVFRTRRGSMPCSRSWR